MAITKHNLEPFYCGNTKEYTLVFTDSNEEIIPIVGWTVYFTAKAKVSDSDELAMIKKDIIVHDDPINGKTIIKLLPNDTKNLQPGIYFYDIQIKRGIENVLTVLTGRMKLLSTITRRSS